jgi:hypothetical protein
MRGRVYAGMQSNNCDVEGWDNLSTKIYSAKDRKLGAPPPLTPPSAPTSPQSANTKSHCQPIGRMVDCQ